MQFSLQKQNVKLAAFNPRAEVHGQDKVPAADLKIEAALSNDELAQFHPALKALLYHYDDQLAGDLVDVAKRDEDKTYAPHLRMQKLVTPLRWDDEMTGGKVVIHYGTGGKSDIVLDSAKVKGFSLDPQMGGTVNISFMIQAHPDEKQSGKLSHMVQQDIDLSIEPPAAAE